MNRLCPLRRAILSVGFAITGAIAVAGAGGALHAQDDDWFWGADENSRRPNDRKENTIENPGRSYLPPMDDPSGERRNSARAREQGPSDDAARRPLRGRDGVARENLPPPGESERGVERADLSPVMSTDGSGLPVELWQGLDIAAIEALFAKLDIPPRSSAVNALWRRLISAAAGPVSGAEDALRFAALRAEAMYRSGLVAEALKALGEGGNANPLAVVLTARGDIALGNRDKGCSALQGVARDMGTLPAIVRGEAILALGYCAVVSGNTAAAGLAADMAREDGLAASAGLEVLDAIAAGSKPKPSLGGRISAIDYRLIESAGAADLGKTIPLATPALLALLAKDPSIDANSRLAAAEAAARLNAISPDELAAIYGARGPEASRAGEFGSRSPSREENAARRAARYAEAVAERDLSRKARAIHAFLDEARAPGDYILALRTAAPLLDEIRPGPDLSWFAEIGIEANLAASNTARAREWVSAAGSGGQGEFEHWLALIDIADAGSPPGGAGFALIEERASRGAFSPEALHRLATVLDALDYNVPLPLWEAASRSPQPDGGHLPETGVLTELQDAAKNRQFGRTVLLVLATLGPNGPEGAHIIALGDAIRALKRAGLEPDARRVGFEALFAVWPRATAQSFRAGRDGRP